MKNGILIKIIIPFTLYQQQLEVQCITERDFQDGVFARALHQHWVKKAISLKGKHKGNHMETTSLQQISMGFPSWKLPYSMWFPSRGKHPTLRFTCFHRMETRVNQWFPHMENRGKPHGNPRFPKGNMRETTRKPGFPNVNIRETTWKPQVSPCKHKGNHMETSNFPQVSLRQETTALRFPGFPGVETQGNFRFPTSFPKIGNYSAPVFRIPLLGI